jgi:hypothetical protein
MSIVQALVQGFEPRTLRLTAARSTVELHQNSFFFFGAPAGSRNPDLFDTNEPLWPLSYKGESSKSFAHRIPRDCWFRVGSMRKETARPFPASTTGTR